MKLEDNVTIKGNRAMARSFAKINLTLDLTGKRDDGYHLIDTVMQTTALCDIVITDKTDKGIQITANKKYIPVNNKNIAYKAAELFYNTLGEKGGAKIFLHKNIPVSAGLAGGSGNGGAVLVSLNMLWGKPFSDEELLKMGEKLGADVPFCMMGGTMRAEGVGEVLTALPDIVPCYILLITPPVSVSTQWAYMQLDKEKDEIKKGTQDMVDAIRAGNFYDICNNLSNVFEKVILKKYPSIKGIKNKLSLNGADGVLMSGSGPTVYGIFSDYKCAKKAQEVFLGKYKDVYLTKTF